MDIFQFLFFQNDLREFYQIKPGIAGLRQFHLFPGSLQDIFPPMTGRHNQVEG
jgi:hypothetical protein